MGARIGKGCVIDSNNINELDLISIGHNVLVAEDAFVSAATIVPPGFVDENGARRLLSVAVDTCHALAAHMLLASPLHSARS